MINAIVNGIMSLIMSLVNVILSPIDLLISQFLPGLDNAFTAIASMLNYASQYLGWVIDLTGLSSETISLIVLFYTFKLTVPLLISTIKLAVKWYNALKL